MRTGPSQEEVRRQNLGALLRYVHRHGPTSRAELTAKLGLNRSTIGALTAELVAADLVTEEVPRDATRAGRAGRPSLVVTPRSGSVCVYAVSIEVDQVRAARVGLGGVVLDRREATRKPTPPPGGAPPGSEPDPAVATLVDSLRQAAPPDVRSIGVGVAVCGRARHTDGSIGFAPGPDLITESLRTALVEVAPGDPVAVGTIADLSVLAEHARGVAADCDNVIYVHGDVGITAGIIAGGRRLAGYRGAAGEVGHMMVQPYGHPCWCGSHGCWETEVAEQVLLRIAEREPAQGREAVRTLVDAAARGDATARDAVREVGGWLGAGVGNLVNIFNPEMVIFGQMLRDLFLVAAAPVRSRLNSVGLAGNLSHVRLRTPALGDDAPLIGASELAFEALLADPLG